MNPSEAVGGRSDRNKRMDVKNKDQMVYMTDQTQIPVYLPYPRFLLGLDLTHTAKVLYALLLDRASLSRKTGWKDEEGHIFVVYPIAYLADDLRKSHMTVKKALNELEEAGLLVRKKQGFSKPNLLYIKIPAEGKKSFPVKDRKVSLKGKENDTYEGKKPVPVMDRKVSPNYLNNSYLIYSQTNKERETLSAQCASLSTRACLGVCSFRFCRPGAPSLLGVGAFSRKATPRIPVYVGGDTGPDWSFWPPNRAVGRSSWAALSALWRASRS